MQMSGNVSHDYNINKKNDSESLCLLTNKYWCLVTHTKKVKIWFQASKKLESQKRKLTGYVDEWQCVMIIIRKTHSESLLSFIKKFT